MAVGNGPVVLLVDVQVPVGGHMLVHGSVQATGGVGDLVHTQQGQVVGSEVGFWSIFFFQKSSFSCISTIAHSIPYRRR